MHTQLGRALRKRLKKHAHALRGLEVQTQVEVPVIYKGQNLGGISF